MIAFIDLCRRAKSEIQRQPANHYCQRSEFRMLKRKLHFDNVYSLSAVGVISGLRSSTLPGDFERNRLLREVTANHFAAMRRKAAPTSGGNLALHVFAKSAATAANDGQVVIRVGRDRGAWNVNHSIPRAQNRIGVSVRV